MFELEAELKSIKFSFDSSIEHVIEIDANKLLSCLVNLISNSIKFTHKGGSISISVSKEAKSI
jgi:signal transduction histidine kinase